MSGSSDLEAKLALIRRDYVSDLPARIASLNAAWGRVQAENWAHEPLRELHRLVHSVSGSGATFGFEDLSHRARELEVSLAKLLADATADPAGLDALFKALLAALTAAAETQF